MAYKYISVDVDLDVTDFAENGSTADFEDMYDGVLIRIDLETGVVEWFHANVHDWRPAKLD